jgi:hypothetical protein
MLLCTLSFLLHCVFIIVVEAIPPNGTFSFIGLMITEVLPTLFILNSQVKFSSRSNSKDKVTRTSGSGSGHTKLIVSAELTETTIN